MTRTARRAAIFAALFAGLLCGAGPLRGQTLAERSIVRIDRVFEDVNRTDGPGCALGVSEVGDLRYARGYGLANLDWRVPITTSTNFYLGSVSKQFTAGAVLMAARQGHLSLDDDIRTYVPEIPDYGETITVRHLVHHTSGLRDYLELGMLSGRRLGDAWSVEEILDLLTRQQGTNFAPGERYMYSNSGYFLLSEIVRRATGKSLRQFAREHIFGPLEMTSTRFHDDYREVIPERAVGYVQTERGWIMDHAWNFDQVGSGGVYSNIEDLAQWDAEYYRETVGGPGFREAMLERGVLGDGEVLDYAFGLTVGEYRGLPTVSHGGSLAGFRTHLLRFPEARTTVIVLCNFPSSQPGRRAREVADIVLADRFLEPPRSAPATGDDMPAAARPPSDIEIDPSDFVGHYHSEELGVSYEIAADSEGLEVLGPSGQGFPMRPVGPLEFRAGPLRLEFRREDGRVTGFVLDGGRALGLRFVRR
ncbi:MAG: serine hydrolase domain-containing protein [Gemmatimonadota bacterium]|nr:serine hydrolase domain-containing protein [Gemmatimonadota bacterium]